MTHDLLYNICGITSSSAIDLEKLTLYKNLRLAYEPYDWPFFQSLPFLDPNVLNFIEAAMFVITTFNCANLASMVTMKKIIHQNHTMLQLKF